MFATIDVGSNTIRMLIGECCAGSIVPLSYHRSIARLAGDFSAKSGLSEAAMLRAISTLESFKSILEQKNISIKKIVGTAALRNATNAKVFLDRVVSATGFEIEVITGQKEALLTTAGVLSVIEKVSEAFIVIDIGGGSTEVTCSIAGEICFHESYNLGVVRLCEECSSAAERQGQIDVIVDDFINSLDSLGLSNIKFQFIGTAGTITTLAAMDLGLECYDANKVNNHQISVLYLQNLKLKLEVMSVDQREQLAGMETGRGNLIIPGIQIVLSFLQQLNLEHFKVADAGLLEGTFLQMCYGEITSLNIN